MTKRFAGRIVFVTGAARGIGREVALAFARHGAHIAGLDIAGRASPAQDYELPTLDDLAETGRRVEVEGVRFLSFRADLRDLSALRDAAARTEAECSATYVERPYQASAFFRHFIQQERCGHMSGLSAQSWTAGLDEIRDARG